MKRSLIQWLGLLGLTSFLSYVAVLDFFLCVENEYNEWRNVK